MLTLFFVLLWISLCSLSYSPWFQILKIKEINHFMNNGQIQFPETEPTHDSCCCSSYRSGLYCLWSLVVIGLEVLTDSPLLLDRKVNASDLACFSWCVNWCGTLLEQEAIVTVSSTVECCPKMTLTKSLYVMKYNVWFLVTTINSH